ncbi:NVEALA domain-containing protein [Parabacteroides gordonii]|jgi:hypothetical protein|uniref:Uncharacterized protein n=1 Tax=Parabacteroides gordonii MS-1 = DSM 23371 TaxID=1203610 RepID=A0A0F5JGX5_9BACT|nr:NVEALA domain-containing protein [Parabacteroides gordonii]KKB56712.1 hypothetical protein HMPREF1536_02348 [Parabacteroides gordonii MS-1 = DSM 23371]MCA5582294.1 NVEALA domain-containing protein [Parabacteroides gordonii]RGP13043.1 hypothetical protein DXB27_19060 [Parabacteroides gordonii]
MKKLFGIIAIAAIAAAGWNYGLSQNEVELSDLALANVEALARYEIEVGVPCIISTATCYEINDDLGHTIIPGYK